MQLHYGNALGCFKQYIQIIDFSPILAIFYQKTLHFLVLHKSETICHTSMKFFIEVHHGNALGYFEVFLQFFNFWRFIIEKTQYCTSVVSRSTQQHISVCSFEKALIPHIKSLRRKKLAPLMEKTTKVMISCQKDAPPFSYPLKARISSKWSPLPFILQFAEQPPPPRVQSS